MSMGGILLEFLEKTVQIIIANFRYRPWSLKCYHLIVSQKQAMSYQDDKTWGSITLIT